MDAKTLRFGAGCAAFLFLSTAPTLAATQSTTNFVVTAPTDEIARKVANCAEFWRRDLALQWLGEPLPNWYRPCPISVRVGQIGAGGQTTFTFENGEVFGWKMQVQGSLERILDSVIPHEVNHTVFASHFRRPLPRWADEGASTLFEHDTERARQTRLLSQVINTSRRIPLKQLLAIREYPGDMQEVLTLYAEGYSLAEFLVGSKGEAGRATYLQLLQDAHQENWEQAIERNYGYRSLNELEQTWTNWIIAGSPPFLPDGQKLAQATDAPPAERHAATESEVQVIRSQSPHEAEPVATSAASPPAASAEPAPLPSIRRQLRAGRTTTANDDNLPMRTGEISQPETPLAAVAEGVRPSYGGGDAHEAQLSSAISQPSTLNAQPSTLDRSRAGAQPRTRPSPPPSTLSPTADGVFTDPASNAYQFPEARR